MQNPWLDLPSDPPFVLPIDRASVSRLNQRIFATGQSQHALNLESLPEPFIGNPETATVILLNLNPGDSPDDKKAHADPTFREALLCNLRQREQKYPFYPLDPDLEWTACAKWWTSHVRKLWQHRELSREQVAQRLCVIEWFPYHSQKEGLPTTSVCPSQQYCFEVVRKAIGSKMIVGMRSRRRWADVDSRLAGIPYLNNPQAPYVSPRNAGDKLFQEIVNALKS